MNQTKLQKARHRRFLKQTAPSAVERWAQSDEPPMTALEPAVAPCGIDTGDKLWINNRYQVAVRAWPGWGLFKGHTLTHLSVKRLDKQAIHDWRDLQWIKNQLCGPEAEGFELYPAESRLVDGSNQTHLWIINDALIPVGFSERMVTESPIVLQYPDGSTSTSVQRPFAEHVRPVDLAECEERKAKLLEKMNG